MTEEQQARVDELYSYVSETVNELMSDLLPVEDMEVQDALLVKLQEQFRFYN